MTATITKDAEANKQQHPPQRIGVPKEIYENEARVAATPETVKKLQKLGFEILIQSGAGQSANFSDEAYESVGCKIIPDAYSLWEQANIILKVRAPQGEEVERLPEGKTIISFIWPAQNEELLNQLASRKATVIAMDSIPRISRAQKMDALSSMANIAGYRAVIEAANNFGRFFTGQITAAGKVPPAKVMVIGAGGYAKVMSKEFIEAEMALFREQAKEIDIIITTALIPGRPAPKLILTDMVESMKEGSVIVDLAAEQGGNCEVTRPNEIYNYKGVTVIGLTDLPSRMAAQSSQLYGTNLWHLLKDMGGSEDYKVDYEDQVVRGALVLHEGKITWPPPKIENPSPTPPPKKAAVAAVAEKPETKKSNSGLAWILLAVGALVGIGVGAPESFLSHFTVFVLACFVGWQVIWNVTPALHTPLMSVTNAISGIIILGGMLQISGSLTSPTVILGAIAILVGTINISGGFLVTQRMLKMFQK